MGSLYMVTAEQETRMLQAAVSAMNWPKSLIGSVPEAPV
jgi:hypothetical protein